MSAYGTVAGGLLAIAGAFLPWLTLDGGLQRYSGTIGPYGWLIVAAGVLALGVGSLEIRRRSFRLSLTAASLAVALLGFTGWLILGLQQVVQRPDAAMFAPQAGPGLFVILGGAILIVYSMAAETLFKTRLILCRRNRPTDAKAT